jgi:L,D-transpeptidase ErfK/SrfK
VIEYRPLRFLFHLMIVILTAMPLSACHYRKGVTMEEAWNELLDSMVPKTSRSQAAATAHPPLPESQNQILALEAEDAQPAGAEPSAVETAQRSSSAAAGAPPRAPAWPLRQDSDLVGQLYAVTATNEDTLFDIARSYDLGIGEIEAANPTVDRWLPRKGTKVVLPNRYVLPDTPREGIVLNLASMRLFYYPKGGSPVVITHPVGIGREGWETPKGLAKITQKRANPTWTPPQSIRAEHAAAGDPLPAVVPAGPDNPLGNYAMRLSMPGYLLHGTNKPDGVGMRVSHGCVRLYPEDIEALFKKTAVGTPVRIIEQPYLAGWDQGTLYFEAFAPLEDTNHSAEKSRERARAVIEKALEEAPGDPPTIDWSRVDQLVRTPPGVPVPIAVGTPGLDEMIAALPVYHTPDSAPEQVVLVEQQGAAPLEAAAKPDAEAAPKSTAEIESKPGTAVVGMSASQTETDTLALSPPTAEPKPEAVVSEAAGSEPVVVDEPQTMSAQEEPQAHWYVQVGSFKNPKNAEKLATKIRTDLGLKTSGKSFSPSGLHRVLAGPFESRSEAKQHAALIESSMGGSTLIVALESL